MSGNKKESSTPGQTTKKSKLPWTKRFSRFLYNRDNKKICGRTWKSWICLWIYYIAAYCVGGAIFAVFLIGDYRLRNKYDPEHNLYTFQPFLQEPGMAVIPEGERKNFPEIDVSDYAKNIARINKFLSGYPKEATTQDCRKHDATKHCKVDIDIQTLGPCTPAEGQDFGYNPSKLEPCIILTVNKIWGWIPKLSLDAGDNSTGSSLPITCYNWPKFEEMEYKGHFNIASIYPTAGFSGNCFPYCGREYAQPFVMVKFTGIETRERIAVVCVLKANNIKDSRYITGKVKDQIGSIGFVLNQRNKP